MIKVVSRLAILIFLNFMGQSYAAEFMSVTVNTYPKRADGNKGHLSELFSVKQGRWKLVAQDAVIAKESETKSSAVWRVRNLSKSPISAHITYNDQFMQPHSATFTLDGDSVSLQLSLPRMVNTLIIKSGKKSVNAEVWFGKKGNVASISSGIKCTGNSKDGYDFPTIWTGNASAYSLYVKPEDGIFIEFNLSSKLFGNWCISQIDLADSIPEINILVATPIPGLIKVTSSKSQGQMGR